MVNPPRIVKFGVWVKYEDGTDVMIVNDRTFNFNFDYGMHTTDSLASIDAPYPEWSRSRPLHVKAEFDCRESMYVTDGREFLRQMDPSTDVMNED